ncbi:hypothetical protein M569_16332, partial [Genlisea aurea]
EPSIFPKIPDDVSIQILARCSRFHHPLLSLVSKSWRSAINSPEIFRARSLLGTAESSLYLCLHSKSSFNWFCVHKPTATSNRVLIPLPRPPETLVGSSVVSIGPKIFLIGGSILDYPKNDVYVFDCRFRTWHPGLKMRLNREFSAAGESHGNIFIIGGCNVNTASRSTNWAEEFNPETGNSTPIPCPIDLKHKWMHGSAVIGNKLYAMADRGGVVYDMNTGEWSNVPKRLDLGWRGRATVVNNVLYSYDYIGKIRGYDVKTDSWKEVRGLEKALPKFLCGASMGNLGGKLCVVWEEKKSEGGIDIVYGEIDVTEEDDGGLRGSIASLDVVVVVPRRDVAVTHCLGV